MSGQLTQKQTDELFAFCEECKVKYYDVQIELVDHLASSIEEQWMRHPNRNFNDAMGISLKDFNHGFKHICKEKERALHKKYQIIHWNYIRKSFSWPKTIRTIAFVILLFTAFRLLQNNLLVIVPMTALFLAAIVYYYVYYFPKNIRIKTESQKKFLLIKYIRLHHFTILAIAFLPIHLFNLTKFQVPNNIWIELTTAFLIVVFLIGAYSHLFYLPKKMNQHFLNQFSQFAV